MFKRVTIIVLIGLITYICLMPKVEAWGFFAHKHINKMAVYTLPSPLMGFYKKHIEFVSQHAVDPDKRRYAVQGEAPRHYIDLDHYYGEGETMRDVPFYWDSAVAKYTEDTLNAYGILPWSFLGCYYSLVKAFETKNFDLILKYSADIGHYIGDATVPLHTTENYNGQFTGQKGIHAFWESRIPELFHEDYDYFTGRAKQVDKPLKFIWELVYSSHVLVDSVLLIEKRLSNTYPKDQQYTVYQRGRNNLKTYSEGYSKTYSDAMDGMVEERMRTAIISVGSIWYSAWAKAGSPDLKDLYDQQVSEDFQDQLYAIEELLKTKKIKTRAHEH